MQPTEMMVAEFTKRRKRVMELVKDIPGIECSEPQGAFYVFPVVKSYFGRSDGDIVIENADDLCMYLLNKAHVSTVTGKAFGEPNCIRISFANSMENIEKGFAKIKDALAKLV
jgi:aspartate aminotransferase